MTDFEAIKAMFEKAGIHYDVGPNQDDNDKDASSITTEAHTSDANKGYGGFITVMDFDAAGNLKSIGAWE